MQPRVNIMFTVSFGRALGRYRKKIWPRSWRRAEAGFTLIELLVVMAILTLLASLIGPRIIGYLGASRTKVAKLQIESLITSLELYKLDTGRYPNTSEGIRALVKRTGSVRNWNGPYLKNGIVPQDPWGNPYHYRYPGKNADLEIYSLGADNQQGGIDEDQDVNSW